MPQIIQGVIHGTTIELAINPGLTDGQSVEVEVRVTPPTDFKPGDGLRAAFGGWSDDQEGLDEYLRDVRESRRLDHREISE